MHSYIHIESVVVLHATKIKLKVKNNSGLKTNTGRTYFQTFLCTQNYKAWLFKFRTDIVIIGSKFTLND